MESKEKIATSELGQDYRDKDNKWKTVKLVKPRTNYEQNKEFGIDYSDYSFTKSRISSNMDFLKNYVKEGWAKMVCNFSHNRETIFCSLEKGCQQTWDGLC